jgi:hypothetical protein
MWTERWLCRASSETALAEDRDSGVSSLLLNLKIVGGQIAHRPVVAVEGNHVEVDQPILRVSDCQRRERQACTQHILCIYGILTQESD